MPDDTNTTETEQPTLPGTDDAAANARKEADAAKAELARLKDSERAAKAADAKRAKDAAAKKAIEDGKAAEELDKANAELAELRAQKEALEAASRSRIDSSIKKLSAEAQADIELVKDSLPLDKLDAFVSAKLEAAAGPSDPASPEPGDKPAAPPSAPPTPGVKGNDHSHKAGHEIDPVTREVLEEMNVSPRTIELSKKLGVDSSGKFGWQRTDDERKNRGAFIHLLDSIKAIPVGGQPDDAAYDRVLGAKK